MLEVQYRMHPELSAYPSAAFYDGRLRDGVAAQHRVSDLTLKQPWDRPLAFLHSATPEFRTASSSFSNAGEADVVLRLLGILLEGGVTGGDVAVITPYDAQRQHLRGKISTRFGAIGINVDSVDAFQGRESNFVIISMVRSNSQRKVGFFDKDTRLNVAITRARYCLVIVGNQSTLCSAPNLSAYIANLASRRLVFTMDSSMELEHMEIPIQAAGLVTRDEFDALLGSLEKPASSTTEASASGDLVVSATEADPERGLECPAPLVGIRHGCERPVAAAASDFCPECAKELQALCILRAPCASSYCDCGYRSAGCSACAHLVVPRALEPEALVLSADPVALPRRLPAGRQRGYGLFRRFVWRWFARVIGYMDSSETLRYWRYARLQLAAEGQALRRSCRYDVRPHPAGRSLELSPSGKLRMCPLIRGAFFRAIRRCVCEYGGLAALRLTATKVDWDRGKLEVQLTLEYWSRYVVALNVANAGAVLLASYGNPGGHALGAQRAGMQVVLLDIAKGPAIADARNYFSAPRNRSPLVHVVSGDATDSAVCDAAVAAHPTHTDQFATFGTPPCSPTATGNVTGEGTDGTRADGQHRQSEQCAGTCVMQLQAELEEHGRPFFAETTLGGGKVVGKYAATSRFAELAFAIPSGGSHVVAFNINHPYFEEERLKDLHLALRPITCAGPRPLPPLGPDGVPLEVFQDADGSYRSCCSGQLLCLWGRGPKFSGLPVTDISEAVGFDRHHVTSMGRLCDALPPAPSQLLSSQLAAHALRIRSGIPIVTEAEARRDPPLGAWLLRLLSLAPWSDVPLPIVRCVLVCCPRVFPGSVLMSADGSLPVVSLPRFGASLVTQVHHYAPPMSERCRTEPSPLERCRRGFGAKRCRTDTAPTQYRSRRGAPILLRHRVGAVSESERCSDTAPTPCRSRRGAPIPFRHGVGAVSESERCSDKVSEQDRSKISINSRFIELFIQHISSSS